MGRGMVFKRHCGPRRQNACEGTWWILVSESLTFSLHTDRENEFDDFYTPKKGYKILYAVI